MCIRVEKKFLIIRGSFMIIRVEKKSLCSFLFILLIHVENSTNLEHFRCRMVSAKTGISLMPPCGILTLCDVSANLRPHSFTHAGSIVLMAQMNK